MEEKKDPCDDGDLLSSGGFPSADDIKNRESMASRKARMDTAKPPWMADAPEPVTATQYLRWARYRNFHIGLWKKEEEEKERWIILSWRDCRGTHRERYKVRAKEYTWRWFSRYSNKISRSGNKMRVEWAEVLDTRSQWHCLRKFDLINGAYDKKEDQYNFRDKQGVEPYRSKDYKVTR